MTDPLSLTHRNGRKFTPRRQRRMAFQKALGETGSVAHAASIVDVDRTTPYTGRNTLPGFASAWEAASSNESFGVPRLMARHRQIAREINQLAASAQQVIDGDRCPSDSLESAKRRFRFCPLLPRTAGPLMPSKRPRGTRTCPAFRRTPDLHGSWRCL
jgi:hypothetical protein